MTTDRCIIHTLEPEDQSRWHINYIQCLLTKSRVVMALEISAGELQNHFTKQSFIFLSQLILCTYLKLKSLRCGHGSHLVLLLYVSFAVISLLLTTCQVVT